MSDPKNKWTRPGAPPAPMFFGEKERNLVKQVNDELAERVLGQTIAYYPISIEESNFNDIYGEAKEKVSLPPVRVFAYVDVQNDQTNTKFGYEYQTKLTVNFHRRRLVEDQNLFVRVGDFVQYGEVFYEIVKTYNDTRYYFGQIEHKFQISAECVRAREGAFRITPEVDRPTLRQLEETDVSSPAPRAVPYPPLEATYITLNSEIKLPNERRITAGTGIEFVDAGPNGTLTISATGEAADGIVGAVQLQSGSGVFTGDSNLVFLTGSGRLGINTVSPTHSLTVIGNISASSDVLIAGDLTVKGVVVGGSPLKIAGAIEIRDQSNVGRVVASLGDVAEDGSTTVSASCGVFSDITASAYVSSSFYYGDGRYLTNVTASAIMAGDGPIGSLQFRVDNPISNEISGTTKVSYSINNNSLTIDGGLVHNRVSVSSSHTASSENYIIGVSAVPTNILFNATDFTAGQTLIVKDESGQASSATSVILNPSGSQTIDGAPAIYLESPYGSVFLYTDGSDWFIY
jgi:hypothetical protein